jgi:hypothetical protein
MNWLKGNLHTHTDASDGDSPVGEVARWYDDHSYDFLVITDHNVRVELGQLRQELDREGRRLLLIPGEELTSWWDGPEQTHALHLGGISTTRTLGPGVGSSVPEVLQAMIDRVLEDGGLASLNHPNFWESITWQDMAALRGLTHYEVYNGHPLAYNQGTERLPSMDAVWDLLLMAGRRLYGVAVDDAHHFRSWGPEQSNPGRGWVVVDAKRDPRSILTALRRGRFYASTGPVLNVRINRGELTIDCAADSRIEFISAGGVVGSVEAATASRPLPGVDYLRVRVIGDGGTAWTQPVWA